MVYGKSQSKTKVRKYIGALFVNDGLATGERTKLEEGLGEIKELISILRCKSFNGLFILQAHQSGFFVDTALRFSSILKEIGQCPKE